MNKQPVSTLSTTINEHRSCEITVKRSTLLFVKTILARTKNISNNILNRNWTLLKNVNPSTKRQEKAIRLIFKRKFAQLAHRPALRTLIIASAQKLKSSLPEHFVFRKYTSPMRIKVLLSNPQSSMKKLHIVIAIKNMTLVSNKKWILLKMFDFAVTQVDNFCKNELIIVMFKILMEKTQV